MASEWVGTGAEIFSAVGTVGAFLVGFLLLRREHRREADRAEDERRAQAARISAWIEAGRKPAELTDEVVRHYELTAAEAALARTIARNHAGRARGGDRQKA